MFSLSENEAETISRLLKSSADQLARRHPSDGLFQNAWTEAECVGFKIEAAKRLALADRLLGEAVEKERDQSKESSGE